MAFSVKLLGMPTDVKQARERLPQPTRVVLYGETRLHVAVRLWAA